MGGWWGQGSSSASSGPAQQLSTRNSSHHMKSKPVACSQPTSAGPPQAPRPPVLYEAVWSQSHTWAETGGTPGALELPGARTSRPPCCQLPPAMPTLATEQGPGEPGPKAIATKPTRSAQFLAGAASAPGCLRTLEGDRCRGLLSQALESGVLLSTHTSCRRSGRAPEGRGRLFWPGGSSERHGGPGLWGSWRSVPTRSRSSAGKGSRSGLPTREESGEAPAPKQNSAGSSGLF